VISALVAVNVSGIHRKGNLISALFAANSPSIRRMIINLIEFSVGKADTKTDTKRAGFGSQFSP